MSQGDMAAVDDRQRVDRWIEESQYLIGRLIPGLLDDRDRLRGKAEAAEQEIERLRIEVGELRREIADLRSERDGYRTDHAAIAEAVARVMDYLGQAQQPLSDILQRAQPAHSITYEGVTA